MAMVAQACVQKNRHTDPDARVSLVGLWCPMKAPKPLPTTQPFLTIYTATYKRPLALARLMESIQKQTAVEDIEHIVIPDHVGYGLVNGLFGRIPWYADACRGRFVVVVGDDDWLADERAVERIRAKVKPLLEQDEQPQVVVVRVQKNGRQYPRLPDAGPPVLGDMDLSCYLLRSDIWQRHCEDYGQRYEGDFDHAKVLWEKGYRHVFCDVTFVEGKNAHGRPES